MSDAKPLVTVNIVTRNRTQALSKAIESAYGQTYRPVEVVVVDNDSSDGSPEMVESRWPDVRLIRLHHNLGCQPGRNIGMKNSRGKYIFNLDDDGALEPTAIERVVARFEAEPDVAVVAAAILPMTEDRAALVKHRRYQTTRYVGGFPGGASAIRAKVLDQVGYFPEYPRGHAEADLALRLVDKRHEMVYLPDVIMYHDVSDIERNKNIIMYYSIWHRLETRLRLEPWGRCLGNSLWKTGIQFLVALRQGTLLGYFGGVFRFLYEVPRILAERKPVSPWAAQKINYLTYNYVTDAKESRNFERFTVWQALRGRLGREHLRTGPPAANGAAAPARDNPSSPEERDGTA